jgi:antitoxin component YwqK of YwqJK toxin-antitoxin module
MVRFLNIISFLILSNYLFGQGFELYKGDTINRRDAANKKSGLWIIFNAAGGIEEQGNYIDNKKEGLWKGYYASGKIKHEITYTANRPDGPAKFYYENGKISEQGLWKINKWVGEYKYFHENGNLAYDWKYNENGKRTGEQKYYYSDGSMMYRGDWNDGKKQGVLTEFYPDGSIKSEMSFTDGQLNVASIKEYQASEKPATKQTAPQLQQTISQEPNKKETIDIFNKTGNYKTFNEFKKVDREGDFVNGKLINGKRYFYNEDGDLTKTIIYENGKVVKTIDNTTE